MQVWMTGQTADRGIPRQERDASVNQARRHTPGSEDRHNGHSVVTLLLLGLVTYEVRMDIGL